MGDAMAKREIRFNIKGTTPDTLPMAHLAEYLKRLATVIGNEDHVHFLRVDEGSASNLIVVDEEIQPEIVLRTKNAASGKGPKEAVEGFASLRELLEEDGLTADLEEDSGDVITQFVPRIEAGETFGPFWQEGSLDGILTRIEGVDETIHVTLVYEGSRYVCETNRDIGKGLGPRFLSTIRVFGKGKWYRSVEGKWELQKFIIRSVEDLEDTSLLDIVARLRAIPDNDLKTLEDPIGEILRIRRNEE
jgi:hypothetical protein